MFFKTYLSLDLATGLSLDLYVNERIPMLKRRFGVDIHLSLGKVNSLQVLPYSVTDKQVRQFGATLQKRVKVTRSGIRTIGTLWTHTTVYTVNGRNIFRTDGKLWGITSDSLNSSVTRL